MVTQIQLLKIQRQAKAWVERRAREDRLQAERHSRSITANVTKMIAKVHRLHPRRKR
jgi:hypothetical protein